MKKLVALFLSLVTLFVFHSSVLAYTENEILFRSIPWGSTYEKTMSTLNGLGITWGPSEALKTGAKELETGFTVTSTRIMNFTVAGQKVSYVTLWFANTIDAEANQPLPKESALFIQATYTFDTSTNPSGIEDDLREKMSSIYSVPDDYTDSSFANDYTHNWYWYGENNSSVNLYHNYTEPFFIVALATHELKIIYTSGQKEEFLNIYYDYLNAKSIRNTDGL